MLGKDIDQIRMSLPDPRDEISLRSDLTIEREKKYSVLKPSITAEEVYPAYKKYDFDKIGKVPQYCTRGHRLSNERNFCYICAITNQNSSNEEETKEENCCYITSACLDDLEISRSCQEMKAMKTLTKEHILRSLSGRKDYIKYGRIAPKIVTAIRASKDYLETWEKVYETLKEVAKTTAEGRYSESHQQYKSLVLGLEAEFLK